MAVLQNILWNGAKCWSVKYRIAYEMRTRSRDFTKFTRWCHVINLLKRNSKKRPKPWNKPYECFPFLGSNEFFSKSGCRHFSFTSHLENLKTVRKLKPRLIDRLTDKPYYIGSAVRGSKEVKKYTYSQMQKVRITPHLLL